MMASAKELSLEIVSLNKNKLSSTDIELNEHQSECMVLLKTYITTEAKYYGRTDDDFLFLFLNACEFNMDLTITTLNSYYKVRRDFPNWWTNRDINHTNLQNLLHQRIATILTNNNIDEPAVLHISLERLGKFEGSLDDLIKSASVVFEMLARRPNTLRNGYIYFADFNNTNWWFLLKLCSPWLIKKLLKNFCYAFPIKLRNTISLNTHYVGSKIISLFNSFMTEKHVKAIIVYGREWPTLTEYVPIELLPEEYGGRGSPLKIHEDAFIKDMIAFSDYTVDDEKYGYQ